MIPAMEALPINAVPLRQLPPAFWMKVFGPLRARYDDRAPAFLALNDQGTRNLAMNHVETQQLFGSKNPKPRSRISKQSTKVKGEDKSRRGAVLIVDDVPDVTEMIGLLLKHAGYEVSTADSARSALRLARQKNYDLVISDIGMPEMNGYELAEALRELTNYNKTPMIAVTGYSEYDDRGRAEQAGFNVHLTKPIEPSQLLDLMSKLLSRAEPGADH